MEYLSKDVLRRELVGKRLSASDECIPTPAAVLDLGKLVTNCDRMLEAVEHLGLGWRPHVKTHKTIELTKLQVGNSAGDVVKVVVSTVIEAEKLLPLLKEYQDSGRSVNVRTLVRQINDESKSAVNTKRVCQVLYSFPLYPGAVERLSKFSKAAGPGALSIMIDHPEQLESAKNLAKASGNVPLVFVKVDGGYHRAGVIPDSDMALQTARGVVQGEQDGFVKLLGLYVHAGHSYETRQDWQAMDYVLEEFRILGKAAQDLGLSTSGRSLTLSVGASPTATSLQHPDLQHGLQGDDPTGPSDAPAACQPLLDELQALKTQGFHLEVHAGVYTTLDLQQLATHARGAELLSCSDIAITILAEVAALYPGRGAGGTTEALVNVGCLGLGREPCQDMGAEKGVHYDGWGILMPWPESFENPTPGPNFPALHEGWQVGKISQEHGILKWRGGDPEKVPLSIGQRVRIWPNHSCIAGSGFDYYLIVDSRNGGNADEVVDVWPRWRGW